MPQQMKCVPAAHSDCLSILYCIVGIRRAMNGFRCEPHLRKVRFDELLILIEGSRYCGIRDKQNPANACGQKIANETSGMFQVLLAGIPRITQKEKSSMVNHA